MLAPIVLIIKLRGDNSNKTIRNCRYFARIKWGGKMVLKKTKKKLIIIKLSEKLWSLQFYVCLWPNILNLKNSNNIYTNIIASYCCFFVEVGRLSRINRLEIIEKQKDLPSACFSRHYIAHWSLTAIFSWHSLMDEGYKLS